VVGNLTSGWASARYDAIRRTRADSLPSRDCGSVPAAAVAAAFHGGCRVDPGDRAAAQIAELAVLGKAELLCVKSGVPEGGDHDEPRLPSPTQPPASRSTADFSNTQTATPRRDRCRRLAVVPSTWSRPRSRPASVVARASSRPRRQSRNARGQQGTGAFGRTGAERHRSRCAPGDEQVPWLFGRETCLAVVAVLSLDRGDASPDVPNEHRCAGP
jgi:hypothetical protein